MIHSLVCRHSPTDSAPGETQILKYTIYSISIFRYTVVYGNLQSFKSFHLLLLKIFFYAMLSPSIGKQRHSAPHKLLCLAKKRLLKGVKNPNQQSQSHITYIDLMTYWWADRWIFNKDPFEKFKLKLHAQKPNKYQSWIKTFRCELVLQKAAFQSTAHLTAH